MNKKPLYDYWWLFTFSLFVSYIWIFRSTQIIQIFPFFSVLCIEIIFPPLFRLYMCYLKKIASRYRILFLILSLLLFFKYSSNIFDNLCTLISRETLSSLSCVQSAAACRIEIRISGQDDDNLGVKVWMVELKTHRKPSFHRRAYLTFLYDCYSYSREVFRHRERVSRSLPKSYFSYDRWEVKVAPTTNSPYFGLWQTGRLETDKW